MIMRRVVNKLPMPKIHPGVRDLRCTRAKEQEVSRLKIFTIHGYHSTPSSLKICIPRHLDSALAHKHLGKSRTIESKAAAAAPRIGSPQESPRNPQHLVNRKRR